MVASVPNQDKEDCIMGWAMVTLCGSPLLHTLFSTESVDTGWTTGLKYSWLWYGVVVAVVVHGWNSNPHAVTRQELLCSEWNHFGLVHCLARSHGLPHIWLLIYWSPVASVSNSTLYDSLKLATGFQIEAVGRISNPLCRQCDHWGLLVRHCTKPKWSLTLHSLSSTTQLRLACTMSFIQTCSLEFEGLYWVMSIEEKTTSREIFCAKLILNTEEKDTT